MRSSVTSTATIRPVPSKGRARAADDDDDDDGHPAGARNGSSRTARSAEDDGKNVDGMMGLGKNGTATATEKEMEPADRFFWTYTEEPHRTRRQAIIKAHPEVRLYIFYCLFGCLDVGTWLCFIS